MAQGSISKDAQAKRIAHERYAFVKRLEPKFGFFPIFETGEEYCTALFPAGRSDRVYFLFRNVYLNHQNVETVDQHTFIRCYQRMRGRDDLVYDINLQEYAKPPKKVPRIASLLDLLRSGQFWLSTPADRETEDDALRGKMSKFARNDLATERDYSQYTYIPYTNEIDVWLPTDRKNGSPPDEADVKRYYLDEDPVTNAKLKPGEFYRKYGLPGT